MKHSVEFRRQALALARESGRSIADLALDLEVSPSTIRAWMRTEQVEARDDIPSEELRTEIDYLRHQVRGLSADVELLKRVALHFTEPVLAAPTRVRAR